MGGPLALFFDGPYVWHDAKAMLEFTFDRVSVAWNGETVFTKEIETKEWENVKGAEETLSNGQGAIGKVEGGKKVGSQPFFTFIVADSECVAARGRGGGLAVWKRISETPVKADKGVYEAVL